MYLRGGAHPGPKGRTYDIYIYIYIDSEIIVRTRWGEPLERAPINVFRNVINICIKLCRDVSVYVCRNVQMFVETLAKRIQGWGLFHGTEQNGTEQKETQGYFTERTRDDHVMVINLLEY